LGGPGEYWPSNSTGIDMRNFRREWRECSAVPPDLEGSYNWTREIMQKSSGTRCQQSVYSVINVIKRIEIIVSADCWGLLSGYQSLPVIFSLLPMGLLAQDLTSLGNMASNQTQHQTGKYGLRMGNVSSYCETNLTTGVLCDKDYSVGSSWGYACCVCVISVHVHRNVCVCLRVRASVHMLCKERGGGARAGA